MSLSTLPDVCLLAVFDRIPLQQVDTLGLVCRRWNSLQSIVYNRRRSLILLISKKTNANVDHFGHNYCYLQFRNPFKDPGYIDEEKFIDHQKFSLLEYSTLEDVDSNWLTDTFVNITNLVILHYGNYDDDKCDLDSSETTQIIALLNHWSGKLRSLKYFQFDHEYNPALLDTINSMPVLKRLWLVLNFDDDFDQSQIDLPVLTQLDHFYVDSYFENFINSAILSVQKYSPGVNSSLKIAIESSIDSEDMVENFFKFNDQLAKRFVECDLEFNSDINLMQNFYLKFTSLTNVFLNMHKVKLSQLCFCLSPLENLKHLALFTNSDADSVNFSAEDQLLSSNFPPLTSVRTLDLRITLKSHLELNSIHLPFIFPNVQLVYVLKEDGRCSICDIDYNLYPTPEERTSERYQSCFQQLVQSFRLFPKVDIIDPIECC